MGKDDQILEMLQQMNGHLGQIDQRMDKMDQRLDNVEKRLDNVEKRLDNIEDRLDVLEEGQAEIRTSVNVLIEWSENAGYIIKYPLAR